MGMLKQRGRFGVPFVLVVGCSQPAPTAPRVLAVHDELGTTEIADAGVDAESSVPPRVQDPAPVMESSPPIKRSRRRDFSGNPPSPQSVDPIDRRVILQSALSPNQLRLVIGLRGAADPPAITARWTGVFLADGKPIAGSGFKVIRVSRRMVEVVVDGAQPPSKDVRLYAPGVTVH
ncbi:MAG: hypothetical protein JWP01_1753 [Myxococcales bacterium]|nr:hypothetical protein [Myxococcales bacterium]